MSWKTIPDADVRHICQCEDEKCDCGRPCVEISPTFYTENGTPMCECGDDMVYVRTEIRMPDKKKGKR